CGHDSWDRGFEYCNPRLGPRCQLQVDDRHETRMATILGRWHISTFAMRLVLIFETWILLLSWDALPFRIRFFLRIVFVFATFCARCVNEMFHRNLYSLGTLWSI